MGLEADFLELLQVPLSLERRTGEDQWGNELYATAEVIPNTFVDSSTQNFGGGEVSGQHDASKIERRVVYSDFYDVQVGDRITFDGQQWTVTQEQTFQNEVGENYFQQFDIENQKKG